MRALFDRSVRPSVHPMMYNCFCFNGASVDGHTDLSFVCFQMQLFISSCNSDFVDLLGSSVKLQKNFGKNVQNLDKKVRSISSY